MKTRKNKGFTLVELLGVIVIIGIVSVISIVAVTKLIDKSRKEQLSSQKKAIQMAAQSYLQANRGFLPKSIGDSTTLMVKTLKDSNYLKDDIYDSKGNSCMGEYSKVVVYKENSTKYKYDVKLYCGKEVPSEGDQLKGPTIEVKYYYIDPNTGEKITINSLGDEGFNKVADPRYEIMISGCSDGGTEDKCMIEGYNYSISVDGREVYSSGTVSANKETRLIIAGDTNAGGVNGSLKDYIDISTSTNVVIYVTARNAAGVVSDSIASIGSTTVGKPDDTKTYKDKTKPTCGTEITGQPGENDWITKANQSAGRTITVPCHDGIGESGCVRDTYTKTWLISNYKEQETGTITIKDNAGNITDCTVRVNIDVAFPEVNISAYRKGVNNTNILKNSSTINPSSAGADANDSITIKANDYNELTNDSWMNQSKFPNGVEYEINVTDSFIKGYTWEVNSPNQKSYNESSISTNNTGGTSGTLSNCSKENGGCKFKIGFTDKNGNGGEGFRYGKLIVTDKAGNKITYNIYAKIDRTSPVNANVNNPFGTKWINSSRNNYSVTLNASDSMSGLQKWGYRIKNKGNYTDYAKSGISPFTTPAFNQEGINEYEFRVCDNADNCFESVSTTVKIDNTPPSFLDSNVVGRYIDKNNNTSQNYTKTTGWVNTDKVSTEASGAVDLLSGVKIYKYSASGVESHIQANGTSTKASYDVSKEGATTVSYMVCDNADNCTANISLPVKIDRTSPQCSISGQSTSWTKDPRTITIGCTDRNNCKVTTTNTSEEKKTYSTTKKQDQREIVDEAGNKTTCKYNVYVDTTAPNCGEAKGSSTDWTDDDRTIQQYCSEDANNESGCEQPYYQKKHTTSTKEYEQVIYDKVHNFRKCKYNVYVDKDPPICGTVDPKIEAKTTSWTNSTRTIKQYCIDNHSGCENNRQYYPQTFSVSTKTFYQVMYDKVDNVVSCEYNVYVDKDKPECGDVSWDKKNKKVTVKCIDTGGSGCEKESYTKSYNKITDTITVPIKDNAGNTETCDAKFAKLTYNNNGGSGCTSKKVLTGSAWGTLCTPKRDGYSFDGWYTSKSSTTPITKNTVAKKDTKVRARWYKNSFKMNIYYWKKLSETADTNQSSCGTKSGNSYSFPKNRFDDSKFNNRPYRVFEFYKYDVVCTHTSTKSKWGTKYEYEVKSNPTHVETHNFNHTNSNWTVILYTANKNGYDSCKAGSNSYVYHVCVGDSGSNYSSQPHDPIDTGGKRTEFHGYWFFSKASSGNFTSFSKGWYHSRRDKGRRYTDKDVNDGNATRKAAAKESCEIVKAGFVDK